MSSNPAFPPPAFYSGEPQQCRSFLAKCSLYISLQTIVVSLPRNLRSHSSSLYSLDGQLSGELPFGSRNFPAALRFSHFRREIRKVFDRRLRAERRLVFWRSYGREIRASLIFSIEFRTLAAECRLELRSAVGYVSFMDLLIMSRTRSTHWNYHVTGWVS